MTGDGGPLFTVELMSENGDVWVWTDVDVDTAMEVYELLGEDEVVFTKMRDHDV